MFATCERSNVLTRNEQSDRANGIKAQEYRDSNPKEPMLSGPMPERPWEVVATDLFQRLLAVGGLLFTLH